ncbi:Potassium channel domain [Arabidopsis thaliana x Arabidopsis arenosa]|uniref:Potassium channel domain n=1 Tax=Arabidopsis thaliana x Arabidopsis arenosa TaxID=1240361 RepID=A0A8T1XM07_9BRAS|nr:Potassium channel domain [Arabidopsis thaliana x Arabidopsis arenosa]
MAHDGNGDNNNDPLHQYLLPLPENNDVMPMTPSEFKNRLLFGPFTPSSSDSTDLLIPPTGPNKLTPKPKSSHNFRRSTTAPAIAAINDVSHPNDQRTEQSNSKSIVRQALALLVVYLSLGVLIYWLNRDSDNVNQTHLIVVALYFCIVTMCAVLIVHFVEKIGWLDSFYFSVMMVTTVGYGDQAFNTWPGTLLAAIWLLVSTLAVARAFLYLAEARVDKRNRERAKKVLGENMSISQFFDADIDYNGCVSLAEYTIYKLKQMEKITQEDIIQICNQFHKLDQTDSGTITLVDLMQSSTGDLSTAISV